VTQAHGHVLAGTRILVTAQRRAEDLALALGRRGAQVDIAPALGVEAHLDEDTLLSRTRALIAEPADLVIVTTGIGFRSWLDTAEAAGLRDELIAALGEVRLIARGPKARGALQAADLVPDWVAESETSAEIADFLVHDGVEGQRIVVQHHGAGDDGLEKALTAAGAATTGLVIYRWGPPPDPEAVRASVRATAAGEYDAVLFTSAPGAAAWWRVVVDERLEPSVLGRHGAGRLLVAAVGPVTAEPLRTVGVDPLVPNRGRLGALVRAVVISLGDEAESVSTAAGELRIRATAATLDHEVLSLSPTGLAVLRTLAQNPGEVWSRERLLHVLPGGSDDPHAAEVAVARVREAVGRPLVKTVVKRGYRLLVES